MPIEQPSPVTEIALLEVLSVDQLASLLKAADVDTSLWGMGTAKSVAELYKEIDEGSSVLANIEGKLQRQVSVANIDVFYTGPDGKIVKLQQTIQIWNDGLRERPGDFKQSVSEKVKTGEDPLAAAVRGLQEELKITFPPEKVSAMEVSEEPKLSPSYPGLPSKFTYFRYQVTLPEENYQPDGYIENDGIKKTYFKWFPVQT